MVCRYFASRGVAPPGAALDLGCGLGGYSLALQHAGFRVVSLDLDASVVQGLPEGLTGLSADASALPIGDAAFDLVLCASLIEHVPAPERLLREVWRVLRPGGACYLSFPPYYSPLGGHQFAPFHLLGERAALAIYRRRIRGRDPGWRAKYLRPASGYSDAFGAYGLYRLTISRARSLARSAGFAIADQSVRFLPVNTARWGVLGEFLTWHAQLLLRKRA
jgi:SAM-dependent methyltransferase